MWEQRMLVVVHSQELHSRRDATGLEWRLERTGQLQHAQALREEGGR